jgi:2-polyprenyl-6-methoxyphenol hydroxylase-like FAD-dependent oxidoreductase
MPAIHAQDDAVHHEAVTCCIAGCGPAGAVLGLLLARAGIEVLVLEKHEDFFRDFRGDTIHPATMDIIEELGLLDGFSAIPQRRMATLDAVTDSGTATLADFRELGLRHPYIAFVPQWDFLDFLTDEAKRYPGFTLRMDAEVLDVTRRDGRVTGLRYRAADGTHEVAAALTVATDGRDSDVRRAVGLTPVAYGAPMDILWFRLSRGSSDREGSFGRITPGRFAAMIDRGDYWQVAFAIPKGTEAKLRRRDIQTLRDSVAELLPFLGDRVEELRSWSDVKGLEVQVNRLRRWHLPGLLFIGDAAHAMSPVGGVGINLAIQDAVAAANLLAEPLARGRVTERELARVQRRRWLPTAVTQAFQRLVQRRLIRPLLQGQAPGAGFGPVRHLARIGFVRRLPARLVGVGVLPEHVRTPDAGTKAPRVRVPRFLADP